MAKSADAEADTELVDSESGRAEPASSEPARDGERTGGRTWRGMVLGGLGALATVGLFVGYWRMSRTQPTNADGASNALQAWDMLHGHVLLPGWTLTDVSFYTTELVEYALVEAVRGLRADVVHVAAGLTYTLLVLLVAALAKGRSTGAEAVARVAVAVTLVLLPQPGLGYSIVLLSPDHTGTGVPLLLTWLILDLATRPATRKASDPTGDGGRWWLPYAVMVLLALGAIGDPLVLAVGPLPLVVVAVVRLWRTGRLHPRRWRADDGRLVLDARLILAAVGSVILARGLLWLIARAGGFTAHAPSAAKFAPLSDLGRHVWFTVQSVGIVFGGYVRQMDGPVGIAVGLAHLVGAALAMWAVGVVAIRAVRRATGAGDRVAEILAAAVLANLAAFILSTLPGDITTPRQIVAVLPLGAALAGRVCGRPLLRWRLMPAVAVVLVAFCGVFVADSTARPVPAANQDIADWLTSRDLHYGLGSYWSANNITLTTGGRVQVIPVAGDHPVGGYRWNSRADWYDPKRHDARFLVLDFHHNGYGSLNAALGQFGVPVQRRDFDGFTVLVYDRNLLVGLPAHCVPGEAPAMAACPPAR